jgi:hypothetical protein
VPSPIAFCACDPSKRVGEVVDIGKVGDSMPHDFFSNIQSWRQKIRKRER